MDTELMACREALQAALRERDALRGELADCRAKLLVYESDANAVYAAGKSFMRGQLEPPLRAAQRVVDAARAFLDAYDRADSHRGVFSCVAPHDGRCPKSRAATAEQWHGGQRAWVCECGRERLDAAEDALRAALAAGTHGEK